MDIRLLKTYILLAFMLCALIVKSQIISVATFSMDSVQLGDPITVDIKVTVPQGINVKDLNFSNYKEIENIVYTQDTNFLEKYADIEILDFGQWKHEDINQPIMASNLPFVNENGQQTLKNTIKIAIYNAGVFGIPGPVINTEIPIETLAASPKMIQVLLPLKLTKQDTVELNPIKDIMYEKANITDYLTYFYILGAFILMILIGYYFYKRKKSAQLVVPPPVEVIISPDEKALTALQNLKDAQLWQKGQIKEYQTTLTDIIRTYIEDQYGIKAPEMTTDEISNALKQVAFDQQYTVTLKEILQVADLVKFAKAIPGEDIHSIFMDKAVDFVLNTRNRLSEPKPEDRP